MNDFQYRLQKALSASRMTAKELSEKTGISEANISNYINGKYVAKQDKCFLIAKALNVDPGWLMTGNEPRSFEPNLQRFAEKGKTDDIRLLIRGLNKLSPEQVEQAKNVFRAMFAVTNPELFDEGGDDK